MVHRSRVVHTLFVVQEYVNKRTYVETSLEGGRIQEG